MQEADEVPVSDEELQQFVRDRLEALRHRPMPQAHPPCICISVEQLRAAADKAGLTLWIAP